MIIDKNEDHELEADWESAEEESKLTILYFYDCIII